MIDLLGYVFLTTTELQMWEGVLTLKGPNKIAADDTLFFYFYLSKEIRLAVSCESSA